MARHDQQLTAEFEISLCVGDSYRTRSETKGRRCADDSRRLASKGTNDNKLAEKIAPGTVDIVLGGHDHYYNHSIINGTHVLRSGSDFKQLSYIEARRKNDGSQSWDFNIIRRDVVSSIAEDPDAVEMVKKITDALKSTLEKPNWIYNYSIRCKVSQQYG